MDEYELELDLMDGIEIPTVDEAWVKHALETSIPSPSIEISNDMDLVSHLVGKLLYTHSFLRNNTTGKNLFGLVKRVLENGDVQIGIGYEIPRNPVENDYYPYIKKALEDYFSTQHSKFLIFRLDESRSTSQFSGDLTFCHPDFMAVKKRFVHNVGSNIVDYVSFEVKKCKNFGELIKVKQQVDNNGRWANFNYLVLVDPSPSLIDRLCSIYLPSDPIEDHMDFGEKRGVLAYNSLGDYIAPIIVHQERNRLTPDLVFMNKMCIANKQFKDILNIFDAFEDEITKKE
jgi:hypothetical protein